MRSFCRRLRSTSMIAVLCLSDIHAARRIGLQVAKSWSGGGPGGPDAVFDSTQPDLAAGSFDPLANELLAAEEKWTKAIFNVPSLTRRRAITYRNGGGDNMLTEWSFQGSFASGTIVLRDSPYYSIYSLKLTTDSWRSPNGLISLLEDLIRWRAAPLGVSIPPDYPATAEFVGSPPLTYSERTFIRDFYLRGLASKSSFYIEVHVGKVFSDGLGGVAKFVPERFPPLPVLVRSWDESKILQEIGKRPVDPRFGEFSSEERDRILITELVKRGLSESSFINLLVTAPARQIGTRAMIVFGAMHDAGKDSDFDRYFQPMLAAYQGLGPSADPAITEAFRRLSARKACGKEFETAALDLLQRGVVPGATLHYLGECSSSEEAMRTLESIVVPEQFVHFKESTLSMIQRRMAHPH